MAAAAVLSRPPARGELSPAEIYYQFALLGEGGKRFAFQSKREAEAKALEAEKFGFFSSEVVEVQRYVIR